MTKTKTWLLPAITAALLMSAGCGDRDDRTRSETPAPAATTAATATPTADPGMWTGTVIETMDASGYTYALLDTESGQVWIAGPTTELQVGDKVSAAKGMLMSDFHSKTLERDFAELYFVEMIRPGEIAMPAFTKDGAPGANTRTVLPDAEVEGVTKVAGGQTVGEIFTRGADLAGGTVKVRGRVVKFTPNIMGTNWVHMQDGTGSGETVDLTVTTSETVAVGDLIVAEGVLAVDKDFGAGYRYRAIIEGAKITRE